MLWQTLFWVYSSNSPDFCKTYQEIPKNTWYKTVQEEAKASKLSAVFLPVYTCYAVLALSFIF